MAVIGCAAMSVGLRARFLFTPLTTDEGGTLAIARAWGHGSDLYVDVFLDRPQSLLATFRALDTLTGGGTAAVRAMAMLFGVIAVVSCAEIARRLVSKRAGVVAGVLAAVLSSAPAIEGFTACGELLSGSVSAAALALTAMIIVGRLGDRWLIAAGVLAGLAVSLKQSGFDGLVVVAAWLALAVVFGWGGRRRALRRIAIFSAGVAMVVLPIVAHAAITGWRDWWYAVVGYRLHTRSRRVSWDRLFRTARAARPFLLPALITAVAAGAVVISRDLQGSLRRLRPEHALIPLWILVAVPGFLMGGQFYNHYWLTLTLPLCVTAATIVGALNRRRLVAVLTVVMVLPGVWSAFRFITLPRSEVPFAIGPYESSTRQEKIAEWFKDVRRPGDSLYVLCADASIYALADVDPPYPALWFYEVHYLRGAQAKLRTMLASTDGPTFVVANQQPEDCGLTGADETLLADHYDEYAIVQGTSIYIRLSDQRAYGQDLMTADSVLGEQ